MCIPRDELKRIAGAPAKLNLRLDVAASRGDGFHELETIIVPIRIWDSLSLAAIPPNDHVAVPPIVLTVRHFRSVRPPPQEDAVPGGGGNLVSRAVELLRQRSGCAWGAHIELVKRIPVAAGLGGGSSDAAVALRLANRAWRLDWPAPRLAEIASEIGSDVPFFLEHGPAICRGRGERIERLPRMPTLHFVVVKPPIGLSTRDVYQAHDALADADRAPHRPRFTASGPLRGRWGDLRGWMHNTLQSAASALTPWVDRVSSIFQELDFVAHQLSGSGPSYFGVCRHAAHARRLATILRARQLGLVYATRSCQ